ncbi:MAG: hypothetical protein R3B40_21620 [Polyangiales bacterium]
MRRGALTLLLSLGLASMPSCGRKRPRIFGVYVVWMEGHDADREELDQFLHCLIHGSTLNRFWRGEAALELRGSWTLPAPPRGTRWDALAASWIAPAVGREGALPRPRAGETPLYLVFGGHPNAWVGACGRNAQAEIAGRSSSVAVVATGDSCWPTGDPVRSETQIALHELVEATDGALGHGNCAAGGACRGRAICRDRCDTFVGLACEGAPTGSWTGCDGGRVDGWVVQRLGYGGRDPDRCDACAPCEFTPEVCPAGDTDCGRREAP